MPLNDCQSARQVQQVYDGRCSTVNVAGIDYAVVGNGDTIDIITEGTHDVRDRCRDLEAFMVDVGWGRVHSGAYKGIPEAAAAVKARLDGHLPIRLRGHSLGAMRAYYLAQALHEAKYNIMDIVTWGCPLFGDAEAVRYFDAIPNRTYQNYHGLYEYDFFTGIPLHLALEPYVPPPNRKRGWSAPTASNEFKGCGVRVEAHSLLDCYIPLTDALAATSPAA